MKSEEQIDYRFELVIKISNLPVYFSTVKVESGAALPGYSSIPVH